MGCAGLPAVVFCMYAVSFGHLDFTGRGFGWQSHAYRRCGTAPPVFVDRPGTVPQMARCGLNDVFLFDSVVNRVNRDKKRDSDGVICDGSNLC